MNKKAEVIRVYLPPDTNTLLSVADHCLRSRDYVNVIVAGKQPMPGLAGHGSRGAALHAGRRASGSGPAPTAMGHEPDVVLACAGDVPTLEVLAAANLLRSTCPTWRPGGQRG